MSFLELEWVNRSAGSPLILSLRSSLHPFAAINFVHSNFIVPSLTFISLMVF